MRLRTALVALTLALCASVSYAQQQSGEIFGRVTDKSGAVLPGVTVTVSGPALIQPFITTTSETGTYRVPELPVGSYEVKFELAGFRTLVRQDIQINIGFRAPVNSELELSTVQETVTVTGDSPIVDTKETGTKTSFDLETLQNLPSARDPWDMLMRTPAISTDRVNVGGSQSGQQSGYISRGASTGNNKWSIDGVDITDMSATGASPSYYDFDMLQEMQVTTGGADASQQTGGVGINLVTRNGTDKLRGSGRFYITDNNYASQNLTEELRAQGAGAGNPVQNVKDYGVEVGGPIKKGRAWFWGSYGTQDIEVGVVGFYKNTPTCRPPGLTTAQIGLALPLDTLTDCLETDLTTLNNYNWKITAVPITNNRFTFQNTWGEKVRNARDASDTRPIETTYRQRAVASTYGATGWSTGPNPFWKIGDQHVFNDRWLADVTYGHLGNNFVLDFHEDELASVQQSLETTTGLNGRSFQQSIFLRPTNSVDATTNYFLPGFARGDHAFKAGFRWRSAHSLSLNHRGGNTIARFTNGNPDSADLYRDQNSEYHLNTTAAYAQDTVTMRKLTLNLGLRWDQQHEEALPSLVPAHPYAPQILPAINFAGVDPGVTWNTISPRIGMTYDIRGDGRTVMQASYSVYFGQLAPGQLSSELTTTGAVFARFPWTDLNNDKFVQANELDYTRLLSRSSAYDPNNPAGARSAASIDANIKDDRTREFIVGFDRQLGPQMAIGATYIWRKYDRFQWNDVTGLSSSDYRAVSFTPAASACPAGSRCQTVTYYEPTFPIPSPYVVTNVPDRWREYNGFEVQFQKRYSNRWRADVSYSFNSAVDTWDSPNAYEDPTCRSSNAGVGANLCPGSMQYAPESSGSGLDNVFNNARWLVKTSGQYTLPLWDIDVAAFYNIRQGYPFPQGILSPNRANTAGQVFTLLEPIGDVRLEKFQNADLRIGRTFHMRTARISPSLDIFNIGNSNTVLGRRRNQAAANANQISTIMAPRIIRFGVRMQW
jgi:Carboxypeptidase regulatory-like domain/TonB-dependent Receptor Plug Domain